MNRSSTWLTLVSAVDVGAVRSDEMRRNPVVFDGAFDAAADVSRYISAAPLMIAAITWYVVFEDSTTPVPRPPPPDPAAQPALVSFENAASEIRFAPELSQHTPAVTATEVEPTADSCSPQMPPRKNVGAPMFCSSV